MREISGNLTGLILPEEFEMGTELDFFLKQKKGSWEELSQILRKAEKRGLSNLSEEEVQQLGKLYRSICSDLVYARERIGDNELNEYLNLLVAKAHNCIYQREPFHLRRLVRFYKYQFPQVFRITRWYTLAAFSIFAVFAALGYVTAMLDDSFASLIVPPSIMQSIEKGEMWTTGITAIAPLASSAIMTNNISVTFVAFALGITWGLGTFYIMALNGLLLGTLAYLIQSHGMQVPFWSFVFPHGVIELSSIFIAGGAGLLLGSAQLIATSYSRKDTLILKGRLAVRLILGCIPVLIVAGIVEAFFSPLPEIHPLFKFVLGILLGIVLWIYLFFSK